MLICVAIALLVLICLWAKHYRQHFQCRCLKCNSKVPQLSPSKGESNDTQTRMHSFTNANHTHCCCTLSSIDGEEFDFFPMSFLLYLTVLIIIHILFIVLDTLYHTSYELEPHSIHLFQITMDYILIYVVLMLSIWVSLFSFYRYYTTLMSIVHLKTVSTRALFKEFSIYAVLFVVLFVIQIHFFYWLFPLVIPLFAVFNIYCTYHASAMLIHRYKRFFERTKSDPFCVAFNMNHDMLKSIISTKRVSLVCCVLYSMDLAAFIIVYKHYNINIMRYLSISWCISAFIFSFNFIRNVRFWTRYVFRCKAPTKVRTNRNVSAGNTVNKRVAPVTAEIAKPDAIEIMVAAPPIFGTVNEDQYHSLDEMDTNINIDHCSFKGHIMSKSADICELQCDAQKIYPRSPMQRAFTQPMVLPKESNETARVQATELTHDTRVLPMNITATTSERILKRKHTKALELLGLTPTIEVQSEKINKFPTLTRLRELSRISRLSSVSFGDDGEADNDSTPEPNITPFPTLHLNVTPLVEELDATKNITYDIPTSIDETQNNSGIRMQSTANKSGFVVARNATYDDMMATKMKHTKSQSVPQLQDMETKDVFTSFTILAHYGFCSRENINSVRELSQYRESVKRKSEDPQYPSNRFNRAVSNI